MFKKIKILLAYFKSKKALELEKEKCFKDVLTAAEYNLELMKKIEVLENKIPTAKDIVALVMDKGIEFYDYKELPEQEMRVYVQSAKDVLNNNAFKNELQSLIADSINYIAKESPDHNKTELSRMIIVAMEMLRDRLEEITTPEVKRVDDNINSDSVL